MCFPHGYGIRLRCSRLRLRMRFLTEPACTVVQSPLYVVITEHEHAGTCPVRNVLVNNNYKGAPKQQYWCCIKHIVKRKRGSYGKESASVSFRITKCAIPTAANLTHVATTTGVSFSTSIIHCRDACVRELLNFLSPSPVLSEEIRNAPPLKEGMVYTCALWHQNQLLNATKLAKIFCKLAEM